MDHEAPMYEFLGLNFNLANVLMITIASLLCLLSQSLSTRRIAMKPTGMQNFMEWIMDFVKESLIVTWIGKMVDDSIF